MVDKEKLEALAKCVERIYVHENEGHISAWHVREALKLVLEILREKKS